MGTLRDLQFALQLKIEELRQRDALIDELELELDAKDDLIRRLQDELDRLRLSAAGQQRASSLRVRRKALLTEPVTVEPKLVLQNPPISYSKSQESQRLIESALAENECMKYLIRDQMRCLVDSAYPITLKQGVSVVQEEDNGTQAYIVEEGKLEASRAGQRLHIIEPGMMFEELALIHNHTCSTTVTESVCLDCVPFSSFSQYPFLLSRFSFISPSQLLLLNFQTICSLSPLFILSLSSSFPQLFSSALFRSYV
uniref:Cyclic nucleotide-binding domain-containing protein n=1 Tax=Cyprinus carpio TaxID=7962 RepID=A0A8C1SE38_CYPCA